MLTGSYAQRLDRSHWKAHTHVQTRDESANGQNPSTNRRTTAYTAEQQETLRRGLRIIARMIARAHLRRQEAPVRVRAQAASSGRGLSGSLVRVPASTWSWGVTGNKSTGGLTIIEIFALRLALIGPVLEGHNDIARLAAASRRGQTLRSQPFRDFQEVLGSVDARVGLEDWTPVPADGRHAVGV